MMLPDTAPEFLAEYQRLLREHAAADANLRCYQIENCIACVDCVFCTGCERCVRTRYCTGCHDSFDLTQCSECVCCYQSTFCDGCQHCAHSNFLVSCTDCIGCDYCFGCVGLENKDFHILNRPYPRKRYFALLKQLKEQIITAARPAMK